jgi:erythromycin esterase-like protein
MVTDIQTLKAVRESAIALEENGEEYDRLIEAIGDCRLVLLGEATHGTQDFYRERAEITKRLITQKGFAAVAVEADWPDAYRANRFVQGETDDGSAEEALRGFERFPSWMWRNRVVEEFLEWLADFNAKRRSEAGGVGFFGLDLYSLNASMAEVIRYLEKHDPQAAHRARDRYGCFDHYSGNIRAYGYASSLGMSPSCETAVVEQLIEMKRSAVPHLDGDELFYAQQNALLVRNAEQYYRSMFRGRVLSWNLRDQHMVEVLQALEKHLSERWPSPRIVVWAHNSHLGDAGATEMSQRGEWNVGQLVRKKYGAGAFLVGFTTHTGAVTAASDWDAPAETKTVRPSLPESYESLFHRVGLERFLLVLRGENRVRAALGPPKLERAIGVIYLPESERISHYFMASLANQFDAVLHFDETAALEPLEGSVYRQPPLSKEAPETFPSAV